jgi:hypothetical protein
MVRKSFFLPFSIFVLDKNKSTEYESKDFKMKADELLMVFIEISLKKDHKVKESLGEIFLKIIQ